MCFEMTGLIGPHLEMWPMLQLFSLKNIEDLTIPILSNMNAYNTLK